MEKILVCAATGTEAKACLNGIKAAKKDSYFEILQTGVGKARAYASLKKRLSIGPKVKSVISSGFAGALSEALSVGEWVSPIRVSNLKKEKVIDQFELSSLVDLKVNSELYTVDQLIPKGHRVSLKKTNKDYGIAVDMESSALLEAANEFNIPFYILRMITDSPAAPLPEFMMYWTQVMQEQGLSMHRVQVGLQGIKETIKNAKGIKYMAVEGSQWAKKLTSGWEKFAAEILL